MGASATPVAPLRAVKPTDVWPLATLIATLVGLGAKAIAAAVFVPLAERLVYRRAGDSVIGILLSAGSIWPVLSVATSAVLFILAYAQLPKVRTITASAAGVLVAGIVLGTMRWLVIRAAVSYPVPMPLAVQTSAWLADALFCGPALVWTVQQFAPSSSGTVGRRIAFVLAAAMPLLWVGLWLSTSHR